MFYHPELIIYLWMLPVFFMIVLPAMWSLTGMVYRSLERLQLGDVRGFVEIPAFPEEQNVERREGQRIHLQGQKARVAREVNCCRTQVANLSPGGICLQNVPRKLYENAEEPLRIVFRTRHRDYQMRVQPRWRNSFDNNGFMIGAEITQAPSGWKEFLESLCQPTKMLPA